MPGLSAKQIDRLADRLWGVLSQADLSAPAPGETEPHFTGRVLVPLVESRLRETRMVGLAAHGDGTAINPPPVSVMGAPFRPDMAVRFLESWLIAVEVKYVSGTSFQHAYAKALGQCIVYSRTYGAVLLFLVDSRAPSATSMQMLEHERARLLAYGIRMVCRRSAAGVLLADTPNGIQGATRSG